MPLTCDCYPGCWGVHSEDWAHIPRTSENEKWAKEFMPHGSYVMVGDKIRLETLALWLKKQKLTIREIAHKSTARANRWHDGDLNNWSITDWSNAMAGEMGEVCNAVKKYRRIQDGLANINEAGRQLDTLDEARRAIAKEIADVFLYGFPLAARLGIDLETALVTVFNQKSIEYGFPERLGE